VISENTFKNTFSIKKAKEAFSLKRFKSDFILNCLKLPKSRQKEINWAKEMKIMNTLTQRCSDPKFWLHSIPDFQIPSLAWFLTDNGRKFLNEKHKRFYSKIQTIEKIDKSISILSDQSQGEDIINSTSKIKTLKDFLNKKL
jgi:hypothetical protein